MLELKIFIDEDDAFEGKPLYKYLVRYLMSHNISGATIFRGHMGFGAQHHLHNPRYFAGFDERPIMLLVIDSEEKIRAVLPHLKEVVTDGLIVFHHVERA